jgi:outer membrane protein assembly factor BamB
VFVLDSRSEVRAFSANDGAQVWTRSLVPEGRDGRGAFGGGLAADGSRLYAATAFGEIVALDISSGNEVWRKSFDGPIRGAPTVAGGRVYFATVSNDTHAIDAADGAPLWRYQGIGEQASTLASPSPVVGAAMSWCPIPPASSSPSAPTTAFRCGSKRSPRCSPAVRLPTSTTSPAGP